MDLSELEFDSTLWEFHKGCLAPLIAFLRSDRPLRPGNREYLADYLEGKVNAKEGARAVEKGSLQNSVSCRSMLGPSKPNCESKGNATDSRQSDRSCFGCLSRPVDREKLENHLRRSQRKSRKNKHFADDFSLYARFTKTVASQFACPNKSVWHRGPLQLWRSPACSKTTRTSCTIFRLSKRQFMR